MFGSMNTSRRGRQNACPTSIGSDSARYRFDSPHRRRQVLAELGQRRLFDLPHPLLAEPQAPANLLVNLPTLPEPLQFRIVEKHLILVDEDADVILDYALNIIR